MAKSMIANMGEPRAGIDKLRTASTRAALVGNSYASLGVGEVVTTGWYAAAGDRGGANYIKVAGAIPTGFTANPGYVPQSDGTHLRLIPECATIKLASFGAVPDYAGGSTGTNAQPAIMAAQEFAYAVSQRALTILADYGTYRVDSMVTISKRIKLLGADIPNGVDGPSGTIFKFTYSNASFFFITGGQGPGEDDGYDFAEVTRGYGAQLEGFMIEGPTTPTVLYHGNFAGVRARTTAVLRRVQFNLIPFHAIHTHATVGAGASYPMEGNANDWVADECRVYSCAGDAMRIVGTDVNGGVNTHFVTHQGVLGCGLNDSSSLGCTHIQPQITGYGDHGVHYAGKHYQYISGDPATVPGGSNNNVWYYLRDAGVAANYPEWNSVDPDQSTFRGPIFISGSLTALIGPYVEGSGVLSYSNSAAVHGGVAPWTTNSANREGYRTGAYFAGTPSIPAYAKFGNDMSMRFGGAREITGIRNGTYNDGANIASWVFGGYPEGEIFHDGGKVRWNHGNVTVLETNTNTTTTFYGTTIPQKNKIGFPNGMWIGNIFLGTCSGGPPAAVGYYPLNSIFIREDAAAGDSKFYKTTTAGAYADLIWSAQPLGIGTIVKTSSGRFYLLNAYASSTIEPSHTSTGAPVTLADGATWWYLGVSTAPAFTGVS